MTILGVCSCEGRVIIASINYEPGKFKEVAWCEKCQWWDSIEYYLEKRKLRNG